jgi:uncharacterized protein (TIGR02246 family)
MGNPSHCARLEDPARGEFVRKVVSMMALLASVASVNAGPKEEAYQVVENWSKAFTEADVDGIAKLYAPDALMIGTFGRTVLTKPEQIRDYFNVALNTDKPRTAKLISSEALVIDDATVVIVGLDTITSVKDGRPVVAMGRVTLVVAKRESNWMIVHMHRSPLTAT